MLSLRPMTEAEYDVYLPHLVEGYAQERARNLRDNIETQRQVSKEQTASLLPQGIHTPQHLLWQVVEETGASVGVLWVYLDPNTQKAFIYDIEMDEAQRGKGYGAATLQLLDDEMRQRSVRQIGLNVFGDNPIAFHLYQKMGYYTMAISMQKDLE